MPEEIAEKKEENYDLKQLFTMLDGIMTVDDPTDRALRIFELQKKAKKIGAATLFSREVNRREKIAARGPVGQVNNICETKFMPEELGEKGCSGFMGDWLMDDTGIFKNDWRSGNRYYASYCPVFPVERLQNMEDGTERIRIMFYRDDQWNEIVVDKSIISTSNKIVQLADRGLPVDSEKAKFLVQFLSQFEMLNASFIHRQKSTRKLGWTKDGKHFLPYDGEIRFDGDNEFRDLFRSVGTAGSRDAWYAEMKRVRKEANADVRIVIVASYASVLLSKLNILPFFVDLWGETEGGKTVTMKTATSIWANPNDGQYIGDFMTTDTAIEIKSSVLNHLPLMIDDSSKQSKDLAKFDHKGIESLVYALCSSKGKSRSNKALGINRERTWKNIVITNGEHELSSYTTQGGATNRILEVECSQLHFYPDPQRSVEIFSRNYGWGGADFIPLITDDVVERVRQRMKEFEKTLLEFDGMQKQAISLSFLLAVDELLDEMVFHDGCILHIDDVKKCLLSQAEVSEAAKAYMYLMDVVAINPDRFSEEAEYGEIWGRKCEDEIYGSYVDIIASKLTELLKKEGYGRDQLIKWCVRNDLLYRSENGDPIRRDRSFSGRPRYYRFVIVDDLKEFLKIRKEGTKYFD